MGHVTRKAVMRNFNFNGKTYKYCEGKVVPVHTMTTYRGSRGIAPLILNLGTRWR